MMCCAFCLLFERTVASFYDGMLLVFLLLVLASLVANVARVIV